MTPSGHAAWSFAAPAADLALAFVNTRYWRGEPTPTEDLRGAGDLWSWCAANSGTSAALAEAIRAEAQRGDHAGAWFAQAIEMREALARLFGAIARGGAPQGADFDRFDAALSAAPRRARLGRRDDAYVWRVEEMPVSVPLMLAPVLWSAADLLAGRQLARVRQCGNERCLWLFLDDSKSGNRRWCSMSACGNRAKAHRHRERHRAPGG